VTCSAGEEVTFVRTPDAGAQRIKTTGAGEIRAGFALPVRADDPRGAIQAAEPALVADRIRALPADRLVRDPLQFPRGG
jgi:hypothetical protein